MKRIRLLIILILSMILLASCSLADVVGNEPSDNENSVSQDITIEDLVDTDAFKTGALEHILAGELNQKGNAVGFHYDGLASKKGEVISGTETEPNEYGIYEAEVEVSDVAKTSNSGKSTFFPKTWTAQDVVNAINEAYESNSLITGNTYEGLTDEGIIVRMYLDNNEQIISAFPVY